jgi:hypothetical protein
VKFSDQRFCWTNLACLEVNFTNKWCKEKKNTLKKMWQFDLSSPQSGNFATAVNVAKLFCQEQYFNKFGPNIALINVGKNDSLISTFLILS